MNPRILAVFAILALAALPAASDAPGVHPEDWPHVESAVKKDPKVEGRVEAVLAKMTLEEKVGQVLQPDVRRVSPEEITK